MRTVYDIFDSVSVLFKKRKSIRDVFNTFDDDPSDRHLAVSMWLLMDAGITDDVSVIDICHGKEHKTVKAFILYEDKKANGRYERYSEDLMLAEQSYKGPHDKVILGDNTPYRGKYKCRKATVYASLTVRRNEIELKYLEVA